MNRVLVTGGAGFIGSHTVDALLEFGYTVRVLDSLAEPVHRGGKMPDWVPSEVEFIKGDIRNKSAVEDALEDVDMVFHLAAYQDYLTNFSQFFETNSVGTALLYEVMVEKKMDVKKVVLASSQAVYGEGKYLCAVHGIVYPRQRETSRLEQRHWEARCPHCSETPTMELTDEAVVNPHNQYAISKYSQELIALNLGRRYSIPTVGMRYSITVGPRQSFHNAYSGACRIFTMRALADEPLLVYEDGEQLRDYVHIDDVVAANLLVLKTEKADYRVFNVGGGRAVTVVDLADAVLASTGKKVELDVSGKFRLGDTRHIVSDVSSMMSLGWYARKGYAEAVADYVDWAAEQKEFHQAYKEADRTMTESGVVRTAVKP